MFLSGKRLRPAPTGLYQRIWGRTIPEANCQLYCKGSLQICGGMSKCSDGQRRRADPSQDDDRGLNPQESPEPWWEAWRIGGPGGIRAEQVYLTSLDNVNSNVYRVELCCMPPQNHQAAVLPTTRERDHRFLVQRPSPAGHAL
jgi:hypothetical protein